MPEVVTGVEPIVSVELVEDTPTEETEALDVLHVPDPVIAPVPFPVRQPVRVVAPVPPFPTDSCVPDQLLLLTVFNVAKVP